MAPADPTFRSDGLSSSDQLRVVAAEPNAAAVFVGPLPTLFRGVVIAPRWAVVLVLALTFAAATLVHNASLGELDVGMFYLVPLALATWMWGLRGGIVLGLAASGTTLAVDVQHRAAFDSTVALSWDGIVLTVLYLGGAVVLAELRRSYRRIADLARTDGLTGLLNRRGFWDRAEQEFHHARRAHWPITVMHLDLDRFKELNDSRGHAEGDRLLVVVADILRRLRRTDVSCRIGGDEFVVLMPNTTADAARLVVDKLRQEVSAAMARNAWGVTCSIGVATFLRVPVTVEQMIQVADSAMYCVKRGTRDGVEYVTVT
ncbi:MAG: GGDEF domain-containing protein [Deltaproteobacteria bacterium]|nr:GGDEF domain-containing protein [Deltaproteobacteria bacterium]